MAKKDQQELTDALAEAVERNKHAEIAKLLKKGADPNGKVSGMPVIISLTMGKGEPTIKTLEMLLAAGLKPDVKVEFGTPLGFAARWGDDKLVEAYLAGGANPKAFQSWAMLEAAQATEKNKKKIAGLRRALQFV